MPRLDRRVADLEKQGPKKIRFVWGDAPIPRDLTENEQVVVVRWRDNR